jgi:hypothetical protein
MHLKKVAERDDYILGGDAALHLDAQAPARELVHHRHQLQTLAVGDLIHREVVAPHMVLVLGTMAKIAVLAFTQTPPLSLPMRHREPFGSPEPLDAFAVDPPVLAPEQRVHPTVPVAGMRLRLHLLQLVPISLRLHGNQALARSGLNKSRHARHSERPTRCCTCRTAARLRVGLRNFPAPLPSGSGYQPHSITAVSESQSPDLLLPPLPEPVV